MSKLSRVTLVIVWLFSFCITMALFAISVSWLTGLVFGFGIDNMFSIPKSNGPGAAMGILLHTVYVWGNSPYAVFLVIPGAIAVIGIWRFKLPIVRK